MRRKGPPPAAMPSWEPLPAYSTLCKNFREANNSKACTWNIITTVWDARGIQAYGSSGANSMVIRVEHLGVADESKTYEKAINEIPNRVFKIQFRFGCPPRTSSRKLRVAEMQQRGYAICPALAIAGVQCDRACVLRSGQPYDFFASSLYIYVYSKGMVPGGLMDKPIGQIQIGIMDIFLSENHMLPIQWFPLVNPKSDLPAEPLGK